MIFDKINFILNILSSNTIISGQQNLLKIFVADTIADTDIDTVQFRILEKDGRNTSVVIIDWTEMTPQTTFYTNEFTPTYTKTTQLLLQVKVTDIDGNNYLLTSNMVGEL